MSDRYSPQDFELMQISFNSLDKSRIRELIKFARNAGYKRLGVAHCISVRPYAEKLANLLISEGFEVFLVDCREGGLDLADFMEGRHGSSCDPSFQAEYLNSLNTDLNVNVGLCLGHGILFNRKSKAPVTTILVKDFSTNHNTASGLAE